MKAEGSWNANGRDGRFINQKRTSGQISKFGLRMADFILSRIRSLSAAKPSHFYQGLAEWQFYRGRLAAMAVYQSRSQFIKAGQPMAVLSRIAAFSRLKPIRTVQMAYKAMLGFQLEASKSAAIGHKRMKCRRALCVGALEFRV